MSYFMESGKISERDIATLCNIGKLAGGRFDALKRRELQRLSNAGLVRRCDEEAEIYALTSKGESLLNERARA